MAGVDGNYNKSYGLRVSENTLQMFLDLEDTFSG